MHKWVCPNIVSKFKSRNVYDVYNVQNVNMCTNSVCKNEFSLRLYHNHKSLYLYLKLSVVTCCNLLSVL